MADDEPLLGPDLTTAMIEHLAQVEPIDVHPLTTDQLLHERLDTLTSLARQRAERRNTASLPRRLRDSVRWLASGRHPDQDLDDRSFDAVLDALHQLDHRSRQQRDLMGAVLDRLGPPPSE